ncbi:MAG: hypothetical protein HQ517_11235 [SAR324 cluster bacterium]|nr:hypothetical protein [SAR324 cluster bacterium]
MNVKPAVIILSLLCYLIGSLALAQTSIPNTPQERETRSRALEKSLEIKTNPAQLRELAMIYAVIAGLDDFKKETVEKAERYLNPAVKENPGDYELMATHGSVLAMKAAFEKSSTRQMMYVKKGTRKMDRALKKDPDNIGALLQRGNNSLGLPIFLKRTHFAQKDFKHILDLVGDQKGSEFKAMVLFNLGRAHAMLKQQKMATNYWMQAKLLGTKQWSIMAAEKLN